MSGTTVIPPALDAERGETPAVRVLTDEDRGTLHRLLEQHPYSGCVLAARVDATGSLHPARLGGRVAGVLAPNGELRAACFVGGSIVPVGGGVQDTQALAGALRSQHRTASEIVGDVEVVRTLWDVLAPAWAPARAERWNQPLLMLDRPAEYQPDSAVRPATLADLERYVPAAAAMFEEELGVSPFSLGGEGAYRSRLATVIGSGRAFVRTDDRGRVIFKAEIGAVSRHTAQIQGVWVHPNFRRRGVATAAMAAVVAGGLQIAPAVSLYVNDYNHAARALYRRLGFAHITTLATVLF